MISHKYKCIFIHISKTGGSSIQQDLAELNSSFEPLTEKHILKSNLPPHANGYNGINKWDIKHTPAIFIKNEYDKYFKFCFVRTPWDLVVSTYFWWIQKTKLDIRKIQGKILEKLGFNAFVYSFYTDYINEIHHQGLGQTYWITHNDNRSSRIDFVGRVENINNDFAKICDTLGIIPKKLKHKNKSIHNDYRHHYDNDAKKIIYNKFYVDINNLNYSANVNKKEL